jgi:hypothetical protein
MRREAWAAFACENVGQLLDSCAGFKVTIRPRSAGVCTGSAVLRHRGRRSTLPKDSFMSSRRCRRGRPHSQAPNPSAVVAARLSDADAKAIRLTCHDHRRRRGGVGAAVLALGSTDATGTPAATTRMMRRRRMTNQTRSQMRSQWQPGSPHESPTLRSGSRS